MKQNNYSEQMKQENLRIQQNIEKIKNRVVVFSGKGGVGKTTVSVNLAFALSAIGIRTGLVDADVTGPNVSKMSGIKERLLIKDNIIIPWENDLLKIISFESIVPKGEAVIWRGPLRSKLINSFLADVNWGELDFLIADMPPGTGDEILTITEKMNPQLAVIVTTPQEVSLADSERAINMAKTLKIPKIALIENMSGLICPNCGTIIYPFGQGGGIKQAENLEIDFLGSLPMEPKAMELSDMGKPIVIEEPESELSKKFFDLAKKIELILQNI